MNAGTIDNPLKFAAVIGGRAGVPAGSTFVLLPGDYDAPGAAPWLCTLSGAAVAPYTFKGQPGARIGPMSISGAYTVWEDLEFAYTGWATRTSANPGSNPEGAFGWARLLVYGKAAVFRRCTIHDLADVSWGVGASDSLFEDCLTYHIGWEAADRDHGHGYYIQNDDSGPKTMRRCVSLMNYATPAKIYGVNALLENITIEDSVFAHGNEGYTYVRSDNGAAHNITIRNLLTYAVQWEHSNAVPGGGPLTVDGGVIVPPDNVDWYAYQNTKNWQAGADVRNLQIVCRRAVSFWKDTMPLPFLDENDYHVLPPSSELAPFVSFAGAVYKTLAAWRAGTGNDTHSTYSTELPLEPRIEVIERSRDSVVVVYNWQRIASVPAPIGGTYRNALSLAEQIDIEAGAALPMTGWSTATPIGASAPLVEWDNRFAVFMVTT